MSIELDSGIVDRCDSKAQREEIEPFLFVATKELLLSLSSALPNSSIIYTLGLKRLGQKDTVLLCLRPFLKQAHTNHSFVMLGAC